MSNHRWEEFTFKSDAVYRNILNGIKTSKLKHHNILDQGKVEINFILNIYKSTFKKNIPLGKALDVSCGTGYMSNCLKKFGYDVCAFDINKDAIGIASNNYKGINFFVEDASNLSSKILSNKFDFILIRESHPFSRIRDEQFHTNLLKDYLSILNKNGILVIGHATNKQFPSISYRLIKKICKLNNAYCSNRYFIFIYKLFGLNLKSKLYFKFTSFLSLISSIILNKRLIRYVVITK